jgi:hypothetical protein
MIISQLWEFHFLAAAGLTLTATILVVSVLRLLLQRWASLWPKTIVVHLANLVVLLLAGQSIYALYPPTEFAYIPRGSIIVFAIVMMIADGLSRWWNVHHGAAQFTLRPTGLAILLGGAVLAVGAMRATADAERGKSDLDFAFWAVRTHAALTRQPEWEAWEALRHAFPREGAAIYEDYILETRMANGGNPAGQWLAPFPARKFKAIIMAHRGAIAKAPAVDVLRLGRAALAARGISTAAFSSIRRILPGAGPRRLRRIWKSGSAISWRVRSWPSARVSNTPW